MENVCLNCEHATFPGLMFCTSYCEADWWQNPNAGILWEALKATQPHLHVVDMPGHHPANVWHRLYEGLVELNGSVYAIPEVNLKMCSEKH